MKNPVTTWFAVDFSNDLGPVTFRRHQACVQICHAQHVMAEIRENPSGPSWMRDLMNKKMVGFLKTGKKTWFYCISPGNSPQSDLQTTKGV